MPMTKAKQNYTEHVQEVPQGYHVRTLSTKSGHEVRLAFPKGPRKKGSGRLISVIHPHGRKNPNAGETLDLMRYELAHLEISEESIENDQAEQIAGGIVDLADATPPATPNPAWWEKVKAKVRGLFAAKKRSGIRAQRLENPKKIDGKTLAQLQAELKKLEAGGHASAQIKQWYMDRIRLLERNPKKATATNAKKTSQFTKLSRQLRPRFTSEDPLWRLQEKIDGAWRHGQLSQPEYQDLYRLLNEKIVALRKGPKRNLDEIREAQELAERFRGRKVGVETLDEPDKRRDDVAQLGWVELLVFRPPGAEDYDASEVSDMYSELIASRKEGGRGMDPQAAWDEIADETGSKFLVFNVEGEEIRLASSADGNQLYLVGGNQQKFGDQLAKFRTNADRDLVYLGDLVAVHYEQKKTHLGDIEPHPYYHVFAEEWGDPPKAYFDKLKNRIFLAGGDYSLDEAEAGIVN
jgi:hypothetical protein